MIITDKPIEGFASIIGPYIMHLSALIAIGISVRTPEYEDDEDRETSARTILWLLVINHLVLGTYHYVYLNLNLSLRNFIVLFLGLQIWLTIYMCDRWLFSEDLDKITETDD